ncbi:hypothetical protein HNO86_03685 [Pseudomonas sp. C1C7]|nr:hypothetical protein [Pseudomonas sp. C1C7]NUT74141.1 hypothetical protein [Pseudomonas sp. C1C7]
MDLGLINTRKARYRAARRMPFGFKEQQQFSDKLRQWFYAIHAHYLA